MIKLESEKAKWSSGSKFGSPFITADDKDGAINDGRDKERCVCSFWTSHIQMFVLREISMAQAHSLRHTFCGWPFCNLVF